MKFFSKKNIFAKSGTDESSERRTGFKKNKQVVSKPDVNTDCNDSRCARKALEKMRRKAKIKKLWTKKRIAVLLCLVLFISALAGTFLYIYDIWANPMDQFDTVAKQFADIKASNAPSPSKTDEPSEELSPTESPSEDPYDSLVSEADFSILNNIVNIMLIGVDYAQERETWNGKHAFHSDVMIVLSINTITNEVNLISLPRDTYAKIPGVEGIYKLNASIDCGGGWPKKEGFEKVCEAASWMLGGVPVQYYYAVDMSAVKALVDSVGGVDFDIDIAFKIQGRSYKAGMQHMDGQAVLDYMRVRKKLGSESGDLNRINRQKRMLVAIFEKIKGSGLLASLPKMLHAFSGNLYTNTTLGQTAGLAALFYKIDSDKIELHSMDGDYHSIFNWSFVITDQAKRVKLIKDIYGIDVPVYKEYTYASASHLWEQMQKKVIASKSRSILNKVKKMLGEDDAKPDPTEEPTSGPTETAPDPSTEPTVTEKPSPTPTKSSPEISPEPTEEGPSSTDNSGDTVVTAFFHMAVKCGDVLQINSNLSPGAETTMALYKKYSEEARKLYNKAETTYKKLINSSSTSAMRSANTEMKSEIEALCRMFGLSKPSWRVNYEKNSNEIYVDFN